MSLISISIDVCGSTDAKARLRQHSSLIDIDAADLYKDFQKQVLRIEETFWTMARSSGLDIDKLFLVKSIGDEIWYVYDMEGLHEYEHHAAMVHTIEALVGLNSKAFGLAAGPPTDPYDWENDNPDSLIFIDTPLKITVDLITHALDVAEIRREFLEPHVAALLTPLGKPVVPVQYGDEMFVHLCNRLGVSTSMRTEEKVLSSVRTDYIGWEIDRFFRITKVATQGSVLLGPSFLSVMDQFNLSIAKGETLDKGWTLSEQTFRIKTGPDSFTSTLQDYYILARRTVLAKELKGVGADCIVGLVYSKYDRNVKLPVLKHQKPIWPKLLTLAGIFAGVILLVSSTNKCSDR